jgi:hypothetical protein
MRSATKRQPKKAATAVSNREIDKLLRKFLKDPAPIDKDMLLRMTAKAEADDSLRPLILATLTRSGTRLMEMARDSALATDMARVAVAADIYAKRLREFAGFIEDAALRLNMGLCDRDDTDELISAARAWFNDPENQKRWRQRQAPETRS